MSDNGKLRVVLLLGAGASTCFGCPTIADFFDQLNKIELMMRRQGGSITTNAAIKHIDDFWELRHKCMRVASIGRRFNLDNYEDILSVANEWKEWGLEQGTDENRDAIETLYKSSIKAIELMLYNPIEFFDNLRTKDQKIPGNLATGGKIANILGVFTGDPEGRLDIVTFNIDFMLERGLFEKGIIVDYIFDKTRKWNGMSLNADFGIRILKLHGSLNWSIEPDETTGGEKIVINENDIIIVKPRLKPFIVEPTLRKVIGYPELKKVWQKAYESISNAHYLIICGYSFPTSDLHAVSFLRSAISQNRFLRRIYVFDINYKSLYGTLTNHFETSFIDRVFKAFSPEEKHHPQVDRNGIEGLVDVMNAVAGEMRVEQQINKEYPSFIQDLKVAGSIRRLIENIHNYSTKEKFQYIELE
jgi:hypothetical protein